MESSCYTYEDMQADLKLLQQQYPQHIHVDSLGMTADGRDLYHIVVGDEKAENQVLIFASIHAREYITAQLSMRQAGDLLKRWNDNEKYCEVELDELMRDTAVHFVPMINPDGVTLCQRGLDGMQMAETRQNLYRIYEMDGAVELKDYFRKWKSNARGVDINRNFDADWERYDDRLGNPSSDHFKGTEPESEAETRALTNLTKKYKFKRTISYHTQGNVIYWYFGQSGELKRESRDFAEMISGETGYRVDSDYEKLDPAGYKDWAISKMSIPSVTIEVGTGQSPVEAKQFQGIWEQNRDVCLSMIYSLGRE